MTTTKEQRIEAAEILGFGDKDWVHWKESAKPSEDKP